MLLSFGANEDGQCGRHNFQSEDEEEGYGSLMKVGKTPSLVHFSFRVNVISVASGSRHSLALSSTGRVFSWGWGVQGQLGHGQNKTIMAPRLLESSLLDDGVSSIAAGGMHSACITTKGECYTWGASQYGQLGHGVGVVEHKTCNEPRKVMKPRKQEDNCTEEVPFIAESIALGGMHTAAVDEDGKLWCWGRADSGQTGEKDWIFNFFSGLVVPHMVSEIEEKVSMVACGGFHTAVVTRCGKVYTMGKEDFGMLGTTIGSEIDTHVNLVTSLLEKNIVGVSCGGWHTVFWSDEGELFVCGKGEYGRLGLGNEASVCEPLPMKFEDGVKVKSASAGGSHTLILTNNGVYSTGRTGEGRLALANTKSDRVLSPTKIENCSDHIVRDEDEFIHVSAGGAHSFLVERYIED